MTICEASSSCEASPPDPTVAADIHLTIADAAARTGTTVHTLRYYERADLIDPVDRTVAGRRRYSQLDLNRIDFIGKLRSTGMPIRDVHRYVELLRTGEATERQRLDILEQHRSRVLEQLEEVQQSLIAINYKIDLYRASLDDCIGRKLVASS